MNGEDIDTARSTQNIDDMMSGHLDTPLLTSDSDEKKAEKIKEMRLQRLREQMIKKQSNPTIKDDRKHGKDFYLQKVTNFLFTSFFLNLAIEHIFTYALLHDYINSYLDNKTYMFADLIEGNNYVFILFYLSRFAGYVLTNKYLIDHIQSDVEETLIRKKLEEKYLF